MSDKSILGIFYTNNTIPSIVSYCLNDLKKFTDKIDIVTSVWRPIKDNPFKEILAITKSSNHLNIIIQILQLLYDTKNIKYKYVSFLEHDVLYPDDYFNFIDFDDKYSGILNQNYIGLCHDGFQQRNYSEPPLHQIIMRFDSAVTHFESLITKGIIGSVVMEPKNLIERRCSNPSVHINHGRHFTTHFMVYSNNNISHYHEYWGDSKILVSKTMGT